MASDLVGVGVGVLGFAAGSRRGDRVEVVVHVPDLRAERLAGLLEERQPHQLLLPVRRLRCRAVRPPRCGAAAAPARSPVRTGP